jgi:hypothetical protein
MKFDIFFYINQSIYQMKAHAEQILKIYGYVNFEDLNHLYGPTFF